MTCPRCGYRGRCSHYQYGRSFERDVAQFATETGRGPATFFWGSLAVIALYGAPDMIWHHGTGVIVADVIWWPVLTLLIAAFVMGSRAQKRQPPRRTLVRARGADPVPPSPVRARAAGLPRGFSVEEELNVIKAQIRTQRGQ